MSGAKPATRAPEHIEGMKRLAGVEVSLAGRRVVTDENGGFGFALPAAGTYPLELRYTPLPHLTRRRVNPPFGHLPKDPIEP